jgi:hypothetical protein
MKKILFFFLGMVCLPLNGLVIDRVILATDSNPAYIEFWPIVAKAWRERIGIKPTLALIANNDVQVDETLGDVIRFEPIPGIPTSLQAQAIRLLLPAYFPDDCCIISDIDMIPLSRDYFVNSVTDLPDDAFIVYRDRAYGENDARYPMCYVAAKGSVFKDIFNVDSINDISSIIKVWHSLGLGWSTDELVLHMYLRNWPLYRTNCIKLGHSVEKRIDRGLWKYDFELLSGGGYIDAHCPRPYSAYKEEIDALMKP